MEEVEARRAEPAVNRSRFQSVGRAVLSGGFVVLLVTVLARQGSVDREAFEANALVGFLLLAVSVAAFGEPGQTRTVFRAGLAVMVLLVAWIGLQGMEVAGNPLASIRWSDAQAVIGDRPAAISIQPSSAIGAALAFAFPFAVFLAGLVLFDDDDRATRLIKIVGRGGGLLAVASLVAFEVAPEWQGGPEANLTSVFVNRNTAATFFGVIGILLLALAVESGRAFRWRALRDWFLNPHSYRRPPLAAGFLVDAPLAALTFAAVFLTLSRGGTAASLIAVTVLVTALIVAPPRERRSPKSAGDEDPTPLAALVTKAGAVLAGLALVVGLALFFAGRVIRRADLQGGEDERFCILPDLVGAAGAYLPFGSGAGTFREAFAPFRNPACSIDGVWFRAHNDWMEGLITLGLPFLALALASVGALVAVYVTGLRERRARRAMPVAGLAIVVLVSVHALVDFSLQIPAVAAVTAAALAGTATIAARKPRLEAKAKVRSRTSG